jgi:Histidine kinase-, DNA gyrase B-, and HSP90-like ATPase
MAPHKQHEDVDEQDCDLAEPFASSMSQSLRAFGYDLPSAIADLVDNSIFAEARNIWIDFNWNGDKSSICTTDDGRGMVEKEMLNAMRPGSRNPLEARDPKDLGRYGLGLKTASFSQCRRLTVRSNQPGTKSVTRCWDLDFIQQTNKWLLLRSAGKESEPNLSRLSKMERGTSVLWEKMDHIVSNQDVDNQIHENHFHQRIEGVRNHLAMVFHRFMEGKKKLTIFINKRAIESWDPFLASQKATQQLADEALALFHGQINVVPYVLPHLSKLTKQIHDKAAGIKGWNAHQGFYIYRNKRLLVPGDWLGLPYSKEEHYKLARILVDIPNSMDQQWEIDVTKSKARPPDALRKDLKRIADLTRSRASDIYRHRGKVIARANSARHVFAWDKKVKHGKIFYSVNRDHPLVKDVISNSGTSKARVNALLRLLEETVPVAWIVMSNADNPDQQSVPFEQSPSSQICAIMREVFAALRRSDMTAKEALHRLRTMEPFDRYPEAVEAFVELIQAEETR